MRVIALSGSLRSGSSNATLLRAAARRAPAGLDFVFYEGLSSLPHFNPELDVEPAPPAVAEWRLVVGGAAAVVISSPEYAHGVPGALKNALDWIVSSGELVDKPMLLLNASPAGGRIAQAQLAETLTVMSARVLPASLTEPFVGQRLASSGDLVDPPAIAALEKSLAALSRDLRGEQGEQMGG